LRLVPVLKLTHTRKKFHANACVIFEIIIEKREKEIVEAELDIADKTALHNY
jgi:hypothetical protein